MAIDLFRRNTFWSSKIPVVTSSTTFKPKTRAVPAESGCLSMSQLKTQQGKVAGVELA